MQPGTTTFTPQSQRGGALLSAHFQVAESGRFFCRVPVLASLSAETRLARRYRFLQSFFGTVAADNPYNPFGQAVNVSFVYPGAGQQEAQSTSLIRPMIGCGAPCSRTGINEATAYLSRDRARCLNVHTRSS